MSQNEPNTPQRKRRASQWFYYQGWKLVLVLLLTAIAAHWLAGFLLERRFVAEIKALKAQGQPVLAADLFGAAVPDRQNGALVFAKAFKMLETKDGEKAADTLGYMMSGKRPVVDNKPSAPVVSSAVNPRVAGSFPELPAKRGKPMAQASRLPPIPTPLPIYQRMRPALTPWPEVVQAAKQMAGVVPVVKEALTQPDCQFTVSTYLDAVTSPKHYSNLRYLVRVLTALAVVDAHDSRMDAAFEMIGLAFKTAQANRGEQNMVSASSTMSCIELANGGLQKVLEYGKPNFAQTASLNRLITGINLQGLGVYALQGERAMSLDMMNRMYSALIPEGLSELGSVSSKHKQRGDPALAYLMRPFVYFDGITSLRVTSQMIAIAERKNPSARRQHEDIEKIQPSIPKYAYVSTLFNPVHSIGVMKPHATRARTALTQILLAAQQYKASHGNYPESMAQVRSVGIAVIPMDPFTGKDFVYKRTTKGFMTYSVGEDFKDDGGRTKSERKRGDERWDIVLKWER